MTEMRHILGVETWNGGSHAAVRRSIDRHSRHVWTWATLPARGWRWRMRTGAWRVAEMLAAGDVEPRSTVEEANSVDRASPSAAADIRRGACEVVFATSLLSIPDLHAAVHRHGLTSSPGRPGVAVDAPAGRPRTLLYMHENQAAYPAGPSGGDDRDAHLALTNLGSILAADRVLWNSDWNRRSFAAELSRTMKHDPDPPAAAARDAMERTGFIAWPPVEDPMRRGASVHDGSNDRRRAASHDADVPAAIPRIPRRANDGAIRVVWPHRWEHDKGPDELLAMAERWTESLNLRWILLGQRFGDVPPELATFRERFGRAIEHDGWVADADAYGQRLTSADWVLSTARHEFFGIAVAEALLAGCLPWLPDRLSYPELLPTEAHGLHPAKPPVDIAAMQAAIRAHLEPAIGPNAVATIDDHIDAVAGMR